MTAAEVASPAPTSQDSVKPRTEGSTYGSGDAKANEGTAYLIFAEKEDAWQIVGAATTRDGDAAILKFSEAHDNLAGKFVAIPAKRWNPKTITPQTVTTLKLEEAK